MSHPLHVVFGAGQIGPRLAAHLCSLGHRVRVVRRSSQPVLLDGRPLDEIEVVAGDAMDPAFAREAAAGADVIYHCMNPAYSGRVRERELPRLAEALIGASLAHDARLVVLDNLYGYGEGTETRTETTPLRATGRKGRARAAMARQLADAASTEGLRYTLGRAGDFFGPGADRSVVSPDAVSGLAQGRRPVVPGDPDAPHAFSYVGDVVAALAALGSASDDVEGRVFHLPMHVLSAAELYAGLARTLGVEARPRAVARGWFWLASPFVGVAREVLETLYQWEGPFLADDRRFRARFPEVGVDLERALSETVAHSRR